MVWAISILETLKPLKTDPIQLFHANCVCILYILEALILNIPYILDTELEWTIGSK